MKPDMKHTHEVNGTHIAELKEKLAAREDEIRNVRLQLKSADHEALRLKHELEACQNQLVAAADTFKKSMLDSATELHTLRQKLNELDRSTRPHATGVGPVARMVRYAEEREAQIAKERKAVNDLIAVCVTLSLESFEDTDRLIVAIKAVSASRRAPTPRPDEDGSVSDD